MGRSQESFNKKEVRSKKEKKRKEKEKKRLARKEADNKTSIDDMIAYVDEHGNISSEPPDPSKKEEINAEDIQIGVPSQESATDYDPVRKGVVSFFNESKGYGFIKDTDTKESIFVHANNLVDEIREGKIVSFEVVKGQRGPTAVKVTLIK